MSYSVSALNVGFGATLLQLFLFLVLKHEGFNHICMDKPLFLGVLGAAVLKFICLYFSVGKFYMHTSADSC